MSEFELQLGKIEEVYQKARFILEVFGRQDKDRLECTVDRLRISGSASNLMLNIYFDDRISSGNRFWAECLCVSSLGTIEYLSNPHISEKDAREGRRSTVFLPWTNWLIRAHKIAEQKQACDRVQCAEVK